MSDQTETQSLQSLLLEILSSEILEVPPGFNEHTDLFDAGLDSLGTMQLLVRIEQRLGIQLPAGKLTKENSSTVEQLTRLIHEVTEKRTLLTGTLEKTSA